MKNVIDKAELNALTIPVKFYRFCAYKTEDDYKNGNHYFKKDFFSHTEMKVFSAKHQAKERKKYNDYCSMYWLLKGGVK